MDGGHGSDERIRKVCGLVQNMSVLIAEAGCELDEAIATYDITMTLGVLEAAQSSSREKVKGHLALHGIRD